MVLFISIIVILVASAIGFKLVDSFELDMLEYEDRVESDVIYIGLKILISITFLICVIGLISFYLILAHSIIKII